MILTNCLCPVEVECNCGTLSFDYYNSEATSVLEVGELVASGECELDGYVIDWYVDSTAYTNPASIGTKVGDYIYEKTGVKINTRKIQTFTLYPTTGVCKNFFPGNTQFIHGL